MRKKREEIREKKEMTAPVGTQELKRTLRREKGENIPGEVYIHEERRIDWQTV